MFVSLVLFCTFQDIPIKMTVEELKRILAAGEGTQIEFKESKDNLARSVYESICAMCINMTAIP